MPKVVRVSFQPGGKAHLYDPEGLTLVPGDEVIVPVARGVGYGVVVSSIREVYSEETSETLKKIMRRATPSDRERQRRNVFRKEEAYRAARGLIKKHGLLMKLVNVEYVFDGSSIIFYFTAEGRVDFRELVKDLASQLKARIELRQVGVRDEAKMVGGLGPCGRNLCCSLFLLDFDPVSIKMAKEQDLPLNPSKISGICGRLMCCLKYEVEAYRDFNSRAPSIGSHIETEQGVGRVLGYKVPRGMVAVELEAGLRIEVPVKELASRKEQRVKKGRRRKPSGRDGGEND